MEAAPLSDEPANIVIPGSKTVWQLAWPNIVSNLLMTTVGFVHIKIVSELGTPAVAAVTTGHRIFFLLQALLMGVSVAATAMIARSWGAGDYRQAEDMTTTALLLGVFIAAILTIPAIALPLQLAGLFGLDETSTRLAADFIYWLGIFNIASAITMMLSTALRAVGDVITPLWFMLGSNILNIFFAYQLAYGSNGFPAMGVAGVALGGGLSSAIITLLFARMWWRGKFRLAAPRKLRINWPQTRQLIVIAGPAALEQGIIQVAFLTFLAIVATYGTAPYAAYGIGVTLLSFSIVIGFGFSIATATLVGQNLGAGNPQGAIKSANRSLRLAVAAMMSFSIISMLNAERLAAFMINDPEVIEYTKTFIYMIGVVQPLMAVELTLGGALRGAGDTRYPLLATFCGLVLGRVVPAWLFAIMDFSVYWIFASVLADYSIKASILGWRYRSRKWLDMDVGSQARATAA
jgi:putative MATE family efflux protein